MPENNDTHAVVGDTCQLEESSTRSVCFGVEPGNPQMTSILLANDCRRVLQLFGLASFGGNMRSTFDTATLPTSGKVQLDGNPGKTQ